jgi:hypothetical protein
LPGALIVFASAFAVRLSGFKTPRAFNIGADLGSNLDFGTYCHKILKPLSDLRLSLNLFPDRFAIAAHQPLVQTVKPLTDHPLVVPAVSMQRLHR